MAYLACLQLEKNSKENQTAYYYQETNLESGLALPKIGLKKEKGSN